MSRGVLPIWEGRRSGQSIFSPWGSGQMGKWEIDKYPEGSYAQPSGAWTPAVHLAMLLWCHQNQQADPCQNVACGMYGGTVLRAELIQILLEMKECHSNYLHQLICNDTLFSWTSFVAVLYGTSFVHTSLF